MLGLLGSHRVGKSTLAKAFSESSGALNIQMNIGALQKELGYESSNQSYDFDTRMEIQEYLLKRFSEIYTSFKGMGAVCDRTPLDLIGYTMLAVDDSLSDAQSDRLMRYVEDCINLTNEHFTAIVLLQPGVPLSTADTSAKSCPALMEKLNMIYLGAITDERTIVPHFYIPRSMTSLEQRLRACELALKRALEKKPKLSFVPKLGGVEFATAVRQ